MPNEPGFMGSIKCDRPFPFLVELLKKSKGFIGIESTTDATEREKTLNGFVVDAGNEPRFWIAHVPTVYKK